MAERQREAQESVSASDARAAEAEGRASSSLAALAVLNEKYRTASKKAKSLGKRSLQLQEVLKEQVRGRRWVRGEGGDGSGVREEMGQVRGWHRSGWDGCPTSDIFV